MVYIEPKGKIVTISSQSNVTRTVIEFDRMDSGPVAPSGLYIDPKTGTEQFQLHRVVNCDELTYTFDTFNSTHPAPKAGDMFSYRGWWLPEAMEAALDNEEKWTKRNFPVSDNHEHCLFSWETIASYVENNIGYYSDKYGWITCESYERFIEGDVYHLRESDA
ncbi:hypothetical protein ACL7TT_11570 [Microbulbifer sp. 2304DJ12-6]|uniref:hypothetical protein n=1 Tax=Microbulbifer sp. 2304DJ12-6 TaxID=3233340 RepID=UPI0039AF97B2